jgi:hypothetical protein
MLKHYTSRLRDTCVLLVTVCCDRWQALQFVRGTVFTPCEILESSLRLVARKSSVIYSHHHMALQPNTGLGLPFWGFVTIIFLQGWIVSPARNPNLEDQVSAFMTPGDRVTQLYPQALGTHFSRLLRHV